MAVGGLGFIGYLSHASAYIYGEMGATTANVLVGIMSAIVDNIPVMFAVLTMNPDMSEVQWLLVTLTAGVGGSMLSIGSAAGVALMGQARGHYTFFGHLKWMPAIASRSWFLPPPEPISLYMNRNRPKVTPTANRAASGVRMCFINLSSGPLG